MSTSALMDAYKAGDKKTVSRLSAQNAAKRAAILSKYAPQPTQTYPQTKIPLVETQKKDGQTYTASGFNISRPEVKPAVPKVQPAAQPVVPVASMATQVKPEKPMPTALKPLPVGTPTSGLPTDELRALGITDDQLGKMNAILAPLLQRDVSQRTNAGIEKDLITKDLKAEQADVEQMYGEIKNKKEDLANQAQQITDESAQVEKEIASQEYRQNKFVNEQAQAEFKLEQNKNLRDLQEKEDNSELSLRRAVGAQLGASFSLAGMETIIRVRQKGEGLVSDLKTSTAIGNAEFSFKAQEIESNYATELRRIEVDRKNGKLGIVSTLNDELAGIDEKILLSKEEKSTLAREAVTKYYSKLDELDTKKATEMSTAVETLFTEKKALEQEKLEKESFDISMSEALGFYSNKYGQPIGVGEGQPPKPYAAGFDETLSKQFGYLVDGRGNKILGDDGKSIKYTDFDQNSISQALDSYLNGDYNNSTLGTLNERLGTNSQIINAIPAGKYKSAKYGVLQCGEMINDQYLATRMIPSDVQGKRNLVDQYGGKKENYAPKVGDCVIMDKGPCATSTGHIAIVNTINEDGSMVLTDANYAGPGVVRHDWKITKGDKNWNMIYGFADLPLKDEIEKGQPVFTVGGSGGTDGVAGVLDQILGSKEEYEGMKGTAEGRKTLQEIRAKFGAAAVEEWVNSKQKDTGKTYTDKEMTQLNQLYNRYYTVSKEIRTLDQGSAILKNFDVNTDNPYDDQALIFSFMKVLDPGSVVREGEFKTAQNNASYLNSFGAQWQNAINGTGILLTEQRQKMMDAMGRLYKTKRDEYKPLLQKAVDAGARMGFDNPSDYLDYLPSEFDGQPVEETPAKPSLLQGLTSLISGGGSQSSSGITQEDMDLWNNLQSE